MKRASASKYKGKIYFVASGKTDSWLWITIDPVFSVSDNEDLNLLGGYVRKILDCSKTDIPDPDPKTYKNPVIEAAGAQSWFAFAKLSQRVSFFEENGVVQLLPSKWSGKKEGVIVLHEKTVEAPSSDISELGKALCQAFDLCE
ncbi:MAG: hypothetical protein AAGN35_24445 [Bacteroidota bacterium]